MIRTLVAAGLSAVCLAPVAPAAAVQLETADRHVDTVRVSYVEPVGRRGLFIELNNGAAYRLQPCRTVNGRHCYWDADDRGSSTGRSFVVVAGRVISSRMVGGAR